MKASFILLSLSSLLLLSFFCGFAQGHTKLFATDLDLDGSGRPARLKGWPPVDSTYVHIWGPGNAEKQQAFANSDTYPSETLVKHVQSRRHPTCTGRAPPMEKLAKVNPGGRLTFMWPTNNHGGEPIELFWDRSGPVNPNSAEPQYSSWVNPRNIIFRAPYRDGGVTKCTAYDFNNPNDAVANIIKQTFPGQQATPNERIACWASWNVPSNMKPGLNRVLMGWRHPPNDAYFYDCYWIFVNGGARPAPGPAPASQASKTGIFSPVIYNTKYYLDHNPDLRANGVNTDAAARSHWKNNGIVEGRRASQFFDVAFYLNKYPDLKNAFGPKGFQAAALHYLSSGRTERRQPCANCKSKRSADPLNFAPVVPQHFQKRIEAAAVSSPVVEDFGVAPVVIETKETSENHMNAGGLSGGAIAGIVIGSVVGVLIIIGAAVALVFYRPQFNFVNY